MSLLKGVTLPGPLEPLRPKLERAFDVAVFALWPEGVDLQEAEQPAALGRVLIGALHTHLASAKIAYLFKAKMAKRGQTKLGVASHATGKLAFLSGMDFVIEFNHATWRTLTPQARLALVDHELTHCVTDEDGEYTLRLHDVEEFGSIIRRWGLWTPDLVGFGHAVQAAEQRDFFEVPEPAPAA